MTFVDDVSNGVLVYHGDNKREKMLAILQSIDMEEVYINPAQDPHLAQLLCDTTKELRALSLEIRESYKH